MRPVYSIDLYPRPNVRRPEPVWQDVGDVVLGAVLGFLLLIVVIVMMA